MYEITLKNTKTKEQIWMHKRFETKKEATDLAKKMFPKRKRHVQVLVKYCCLLLLFIQTAIAQVDLNHEKLVKDLALAEANRDAYEAKKKALPKPVVDKKFHDIGPISTKDYNAKYKALEAQKNAWSNEVARIKKELGVK